MSVSPPRKKSRATVLPDHWAGCSKSFYLWPYRAKLDALAEKVRHRKLATPSNVVARFNPKSRVAEIFVDDHIGVIAQITVEGAFGTADYARIWFRKDVFSKSDFREVFGDLKILSHKLLRP